MGNSEVGHMIIGAGRVISQDLYHIDQAIETGSFHVNDVINRLMNDVQDAILHVFGLLSPGGVHSHERHFESVIQLAARHRVKLAVHAFLDGRDTPPKSAASTLASIEKLLRAHDTGQVVSISGRFYAMDRDHRWERTERAYQMISSGKGDFVADTVEEALANAYERGEADEFVQPTTINPTAIVRDGDAVLFMNFRADRARQLTKAFVEDSFTDFVRETRPQLKRFVTLTSYGLQVELNSSSIPMEVVFEKESVDNSLGEYLQNMGKSQLRIAETEKYAHVTYFFSGGREKPFEQEAREFIPSAKVLTYDLQPEMSAREITDRVTTAVRQSEFDVIVCNFANGDMVGHTGNLDASMQAVEVVDECLGRISQVIEETGSDCLITADHGNVECLVDSTTHSNHTAHTLNQVPLVYLGPKNLTLRSGGTLADVSPTLLDLMDLPIPIEMSGSSLVQPV